MSFAVPVSIRSDVIDGHTGLDTRYAGSATQQEGCKARLDVDHVELVAEVGGRDKGGQACADERDDSVDNAVELGGRGRIQRVTRQGCRGRQERALVPFWSRQLPERAISQDIAIHNFQSCKIFVS